MNHGMCVRSTAEGLFHRSSLPRGCFNFHSKWCHFLTLNLVEPWVWVAMMGNSNLTTEKAVTSDSISSWSSRSSWQTLRFQSHVHPTWCPGVQVTRACCLMWINSSLTAQLDYLHHLENPTILICNRML